MLRELLLIISFGALSQQACPPGFITIYYDAAQTIPLCMKFQLFVADWNSHLLTCQSLGLTLAQPESLNAQSELQTYILNSPGLVGKGFFLGGSDLFKEGDWTWVTNGNTMNVIWSQNPYPEPDGGTSQNCACLWRQDYLMHSCKCGYNTYAICQI